jgi:hypothetical protein
LTFAAIEVGALLLGAAALVSALGGVASTFMALKKSRDEDYEACLERLKTARAELEEKAAELHQLRMGDAG